MQEFPGCCNSSTIFGMSLSKQSRKDAVPANHVFLHTDDSGRRRLQVAPCRRQQGLGIIIQPDLSIAEFLVEFDGSSVALFDVEEALVGSVGVLYVLFHDADQLFGETAPSVGPGHGQIAHEWGLGKGRSLQVSVGYLSHFDPDAGDDCVLSVPTHKEFGSSSFAAVPTGEFGGLGLS